MYKLSVIDYILHWLYILASTNSDRVDLYKNDSPKKLKRVYIKFNVRIGFNYEKGRTFWWIFYYVLEWTEKKRNQIANYKCICPWH